MLPRCVVVWGGLLLALLLAPRHADAQEPPSRVSVLTMGPGDHPFTRFGHNAILLEWNGARSAVYNYGTFEFDGLQGVSDFMTGRFRYWLSVGALPSTVRAYGAAQRSLVAQELELSAAERARLYEALERNAQPEHRYYDYDYYRDNCSTRVRDALSELLGGELTREVTGSGRFTFRQHTLRLVGDAPLLYFGLDVALGAPTDRPISRWEELFLPQELHDELAHATREVAGKHVPLVRAERVLLRANRAPLASAPPRREASFALLGAVLGLGGALLGHVAARRRSARIAFGTTVAALGLVLGLLGTALVIFWSSKHWAAHQNWVAFACPPWLLALVPYGVSVARGRARAASVVSALFAATALTTLGFVLPSLPSAERLRDALLFFPLWAGFFYGAWRARRPHSHP
jgi:hypothetical protein